MVTVHIPPLRERREEIPVFLDFFLRKYSEYYSKQPPPFSDYAISRMMEYTWPGNIRELENMAKRYVIVGNEAQIIRELSTHKPIMSSVSSPRSPQPVPEATAPPAPPSFASGNGSSETPSVLEIGRRAAMQAEREAIERVLNQTRWNRRQAAKILKISYKALLNKLKAMEEEQNQSKQRSALEVVSRYRIIPALGRPRFDLDVKMRHSPTLMSCLQQLSAKRRRITQS